ncbi:MAG: D-alanine--D-alanine ligase [Candidatus Sumerlaeota bacterium]|nr:D-alanine--D-alanine ligase [Candidatus Sumerlaeota bacterium]
MNNLLWVICGGISSEHDVSLMSGRQIASSLAGGEWRVRPVVIAKDGAWRVADEILGTGAAPAEMAALIESLAHDASTTSPLEKALSKLLAEKPACVFIAMHGAGGEDGAIQGMFNWLGVRYTGSGPSASALGMNKIRCQDFFAHRGFLTPPAVSSVDLDEEDRLDRRRHAAALVKATLERLSLPVFVKPSFGGSSLGLTLVKRREDLKKAINLSLRYSSEVLIEERIAGRELTCGVIEQRDGDRRSTPLALALTEILPVKSEYFDYEAKYTPGACKEITPAAVDEDIAQRIREAAFRAHTLLGCRGMSRSDFILRDDGAFYMLEINTIPGMTPTSLLPQQAAHAGLSFYQLCDRIVVSAFDKNLAS